MKTIDEIIQEFRDKCKKLITNSDGGFMVLLDYRPHEAVLDETYVEDFLRSSLSETEKRVRKETIGEVDKWISDEIKIAHGLDCDKIVRKYPLSGGYRECECGASSKEYAFIKVKDKLTDLLNEKE